MGEQIPVKDWSLAYRALYETPPAFQYHLLDTVLFDQIQANRPLAWVQTSPNGVVVEQDLHSHTLSEVLQEIYQKTAPLVPLKRYLPLPEPITSLAVAIVGKERRVLTRKTLLNLQSLYPRGIEGLTLLRVPGFNFDSRVFIYQLTSDATGTHFDDSVRIRVRDVLERNLTGLYSEAQVLRMVQRASAELIQRLQLVFKQKIRSITASFRFEMVTEKPWLLGIEDLSLVKSPQNAVIHKGKPAINVVSLGIKRENPVQTPLYHFKMQEWLQIRSSWSDPNSHKPLLKSVSCQALSESTISLPERTAKAVKIKRKRHPTGLIAGLKEARVFSDICTGKYCGCKGIRYADYLPYSRKSRFLVPITAVELAEKQEFSPLYHPALLLKPCAEMLLEGCEEDQRVSVCLRCYFVYCNVLQAYHRSQGPKSIHIAYI